MLDKESKIMKFSKLRQSKISATSNADKLKKTNAKVKAFKHEFCVLSADDVNNNRAKAYQYLAL